MRLAGLWSVETVPNYRRDAALAVGALAALVWLLVATGATGALWQPVAVAVGVAGALVVELGFLQSPSAAALWERPAVRVAGVLTVVGGGVWTYAAVGPSAVAAVCWGLATYFVLLGAVLVLGRNPLAVGD